MEFSFFNNTCIGHQMFVLTNKKYTNPFIGSLFVYDHQFLKFCKNIHKYLNLIPSFNSPSDNANRGKKYYPNMGIYPVMYLDDIEIHWIHEKDENELLEKYNRRKKRFLQEYKGEIMCIFSYSQCLQDHSDDEMKRFINDFLNIENIYTVFLGPEKYNIKSNENHFYIKKFEWNNISMNRNEFGILHFNDQTQIKNDIVSSIKLF